MLEELIRNNDDLRQRLAAIITQSDSASPPRPGSLGYAQPFEWEGKGFTSPIDVIVTPNEVNLKHGTGVLLKKIFADDRSVVSIRTSNHYAGDHHFGQVSFCLPSTGMTRSDIFLMVSQWLAGAEVRRVLCVPFFPDDLIVAMAVADVFAAPLCTYIMDDQNCRASGIPDPLMRETLTKSSLRLAISPEMQRAYENKYRLKFWMLPPVVSSDLIRSRIRTIAMEPGSSKTGVMVGNIWGQQWLDLLRTTIKDSGYRVRWFCNNPDAKWLTFTREEMERDGITLCHPLPEPELAAVLSRHPFAVVPSGTLDDRDDNPAVAQFSLPTRIPFIVATSHTPLVIIGHPNVAAAKFVRRFALGATCVYDPAAFRKAVQDVLQSENQLAMRKQAASIADIFAADGAAKWVWQALERGEPDDLKYEELMPVQPGEFAYYVNAPAPKELVDDFIPTYQALKKLKRRGFEPDFVVDIGASTGIWSHTVQQLFPDCRFILVEPLASRYHKSAIHSNFEVVETALSDRPGKIEFQVSADLYGSSMLAVGGPSSLSELIEVPVRTLDALAKEKKISGRGIVKIDVQYAEHMVLEGGLGFLAGHVDAVIVELTLLREHKDAKTFLEMLNFMSELGFNYFDDAGEWRDPKQGILEQKDVLFVRSGLFV